MLLVNSFLLCSVNQSVADCAASSCLGPVLPGAIVAPTRGILCGQWARPDGFDVPVKLTPNILGLLAGYKNLATSIFPVFSSPFMSLDACHYTPILDTARIKFSTRTGGSEPSAKG